MIKAPKLLFSCLFVLSLTGCPFSKGTGTSDSNSSGANARLVMFIGMDISGSFASKWYFKDSIRFLSRYIYAHLNGLGGLEVPHSLFVGSIGGATADEPKTFYPIHTFQHRSIKEIEIELRQIFPKKTRNPFTDYNAFFDQVSVFVKNKKLVMKPISIVMFSDGIPDAPKKNGKHDYRSIKLRALENLARDITVRVLYTSAPVGINWQTKVPRQRVKVWTQDANVMKGWKDKHILLPRKKFKTQKRFFSWIHDNVDFKVPRKRID